MPLQRDAGFELDSTFVQLQDGAAVVLVPVGSDFWTRIEERADLHQGRLLMVTRQTGEGMHWEMHPAGDEVLYLLSGRMDVILQEGGSERIIGLRPGTAAIVPQGIWHTVKIHDPGDLLSITRTAGTQVRSA